MKIELLYFAGCPNHERWHPCLHELLEAEGVTSSVELVAVESAAAAQKERFLGSPTLRIDGVDVDPGAAERTDFGLKCRLFAVDGALVGAPPDEWVLAAVRRATG